MNTFNHLHVHSHFSLLNGLAKIQELVDAAKEDGMTSLALTDDCNLYGAIEFYEKCKKADINPIIGVDAFVAARTRHDKEGRVDADRSRLVLLAKDYVGYQTLIKLVTDANLEGFYYKPRIDKELIEKHNENLICIAPMFSGATSKALRTDDYETATEWIDLYKKSYGEENVYLELVMHPEISGMDDLSRKVIKLAKETNTQLVAAHDVYYIHKDDHEARETLRSVSPVGGRGGGGAFEDDEDFSFISQQRAEELFKDHPEALANTTKIASQCNFEIELGVWKFPEFEIPSGRTADEELRHMTYEGVKRKKLELTKEIEERIEYELDVIKTKGYDNYFLAVADLLRFAKENGILSNTRGSAAGSFVSFLVGITTVNPIDFRLPFERFLNPGRPSAPDVDMDFADTRRDEVIEYSRNKYGRDKVAQIGTFGTMLARGAVRDTARAMGFEYSAGDQIAKLIPMGAQGFPMTIDRAMDEVPELTDLYKKDADSRRIMDMARKIEGCARHIGVHAAGVVISPDPLVNDVPVQWDPKGEGKLITQYDMHAVGEDGVGLLKFDFLGLKNLTIMGNTIKLIKKVYNEDVDVEYIPLDDTKTYEMLAKGETAATFQLNGSGMTRFLKELKPTNIDDVCAMVALYRPGPMAFIPDYIERKHDPSKAEYLDERFKEYLEPTYGILIYQDDIMLLAVNFAGYSWGEADKFRKAMGKKIPELMAEQKTKFFAGCQEVGGLSKQKTKELWEQIETFAAYGFNKAHSASYGWVAYLTSYFKANYPVLYMASVLTADQGDTEKIAEMVDECKRMGIEVLPPDINESFEDFATVGKEKKIRFGLTTIKNFGEGIAHSIVEERKANGPFTTLEDFMTRIKDRTLNRKSLEALIKAGAMDTLGKRSQLLGNLEALIEYSKGLSKESSNQDSLFASVGLETPSITLEKTPEISEDQALMWEKELLGLFISGHPLEKFREEFEKRESTIATIKANPQEEKTEVVAGIIQDVRVIRTKKNDEMAFIKLQDFTDSIEVVAFPRTYTQFKNILEPDMILAIKGKVSIRNEDEISILADKIKRLEK